MRLPLSRSAARRRALVAPLVALCLVILIGVAAITIDGGVLMSVQRRVQMSTDAAALAAAVDLAQNYQKNKGLDPQGTAKQSALTTAAANGYTSSNSTITVNIPPKSGPFTGKAGYVEVTILYQQPRAFSALWGKNSLGVGGRAVARGVSNTPNIAVLLLDPTKQGALSLTGNGSVVIGGGATLVVDSSSSSAISLTGNASVTATEVDVVGSPGVSTTGNAGISGTLKAGSPSVADPLATLTPPDPSTMTVQSNSQLSLTGQQSATLNPGVYVGGISLSGKASITLNPGIYYLQGGGISATGQGNITGSGVMIYNDASSSSDAIDLSGKGSITLSPPTSGPYAGITIFQNRTSDAPIHMTGNGSTSVQGTVYAPDAPVTLTGNGGLNANGDPNDSLGGQYIVDSISTTGNGSFSVGQTGTPAATKKDIRLVE